MQPTKSLILCLIAATSLAACGGGRRAEAPPRPPMDPAKMEMMVRQLIDRWDYDENGAATCDDMRLQRSRLFRTLDKNKDGLLSADEYRHAQFEDKSFMFYDFLRLDKNSDENLTLAEFAMVPNSQFQALDRNGDCTVSPEEAMESVRTSRMDRSLGDKPARGAGRGEGRGPGGGRGEGGGDGDRPR